MICEKSECCGCGLCYNQCQFDAIKMVPDEEGFLYPQIDEEKCVHCDRCLKTCPAIHKIVKSQSDYQEKAYAGYCTVKDKLLSSSSGGAAYAIAKAFLSQGGTVFGVRYNENYKGARFTAVEKAADLEMLSESKYVESNRQILFQKLNQILNSEKKVLVIGLPCDIAAVRSIAGWRKNLYTCKLICRSNTSNKVLQEFLTQHELTQKSVVKKISLRYKIDGAPVLPTRIRIDFENGSNFIDEFTKTDFGIAFQIFARPACLHCNYKSIRQLADITIGDFQGISKEAEYYNVNGVSLILQHTPKGEDLLKKLEDFYLKEVPFDAVTKYNWMAHTAIPESPFRKEFSDVFTHSGLRVACAKLRESQNEKIDQISNNLINSGARVAVWGIGDTAECLYDRFRMEEWNIVSIYDSSLLKIGRRFKHWQIQNILDIMQKESEVDILAVMIPSENEEKLNTFIKEIGWEKPILHVGKYKFYKG